MLLTRHQYSAVWSQSCGTSDGEVQDFVKLVKLSSSLRTSEIFLQWCYEDIKALATAGRVRLFKVSKASEVWQR